MSKLLTHDTRISPQIIEHKSLKSQLSAFVFRKIGKLASFSNVDVVFFRNYVPASLLLKDIVVWESLGERCGVSFQTFRRGSAFLCESAVVWQTVVLGQEC
jgi:hypothetical protein